MQAERQHRRSAPQVSLFPEFVGGVWELAIYALGGRMILRLRLSPVSRREGQLTLLDLHRERRTVTA